MRSAREIVYMYMGIFWVIEEEIWRQIVDFDRSVKVFGRFESLPMLTNQIIIPHKYLVLDLNFVFVIRG